MERKWITGGIAGGGLLFFAGLVIYLYGIFSPLQPDEWWLSPAAEAEAATVGEAVAEVAAEAVALERRRSLPSMEIAQPEIVEEVAEEAAWETAANPNIVAVAEAAVAEAVAASAEAAEEIAKTAAITEAEKAMQAAMAATNPEIVSEVAAAAEAEAVAASAAVSAAEAPLTGMLSRLLIAGDGFPVPGGFPIFGIIIWIIVGGIGFYGGWRGMTLYNQHFSG